MRINVINDYTYTLETIVQAGRNRIPTRSTLDEKCLQGALDAGLSIKKVIKIPCMNLNNLLEKENFEPDFISIDIEGMDYRVLRSLDFRKHPVKVIIAERSGEKNEKGETMNEFMSKSRYDVYGEYKSNVIYVKR